MKEFFVYSEFKGTKRYHLIDGRIKGYGWYLTRCNILIRQPIITQKPPNELKRCTNCKPRVRMSRRYLPKAD